jgi:hypothetical protein
MSAACSVRFFHFQAAHRRSEETMRSNHFVSTIFGTITSGQGSTIAVEGTHRSALRDLVFQFARRLSLRLIGWRALKRMPAMMPALAACPSYSVNRRLRGQRSVAGVVVDSATVGVS